MVDDDKPCPASPCEPGQAVVLVVGQRAQSRAATENCGAGPRRRQRPPQRPLHTWRMVGSTDTATLAATRPPETMGSSEKNFFLSPRTCAPGRAQRWRGMSGAHACATVCVAARRHGSRTRSPCECISERASDRGDTHKHTERHGKDEPSVLQHCLNQRGRAVTRGRVHCVVERGTGAQAGGERGHARRATGRDADAATPLLTDEKPVQNVQEAHHGGDLPSGAPLPRLPLADVVGYGEHLPVALVDGVPHEKRAEEEREPNVGKKQHT